MQKQVDSLVEVDAFLSELSCSVHGVLVRLVLDHLHPFAALALLMTVFADHVKLADPILQEEQTNRHTKPGLLHVVSTVGRRWRSQHKRVLGAQMIEPTVKFWSESPGKKESLGRLDGRRGGNKVSRIIALTALHSKTDRQRHQWKDGGCRMTTCLQKDPTG